MPNLWCTRFVPESDLNLRVQVWQGAGLNPEVRVQVQAHSAQTRTKLDRSSVSLKPGAPGFEPKPKPTEPEPVGLGVGLANDCTRPQVWVQVQPKTAQTHTEPDHGHSFIFVFFHVLHPWHAASNGSATGNGLSSTRQQGGLQGSPLHMCFLHSVILFKFVIIDYTAAKRFKCKISKFTLFCSPHTS